MGAVTGTHLIAPPVVGHALGVLLLEVEAVLHEEAHGPGLHDVVCGAEGALRIQAAGLGSRAGQKTAVERYKTACGM